jgi:hypothetical protein
MVTSTSPLEYGGQTAYMESNPKHLINLNHGSQQELSKWWVFII